jgi:hypothetical protein
MYPAEIQLVCVLRVRHIAGIRTNVENSVKIVVFGLGESSLFEDSQQR